MPVVLQFVFAIATIWLMLFVWIHVNARHSAAMRDVDPCRLRSGCAGCAHHCEREHHE